MEDFHWHAQFEEEEPILPGYLLLQLVPGCSREGARAANSRSDVAAKARWILTEQQAAWRDWRAGVLVDRAGMLGAIVNASGRKRCWALTIAHGRIRNSTERYGSSSESISYPLAPEIDVFSPMVYHGRMGRKPEWVRDAVERISARLPDATRIWPIVQAHSSSAPISASEFEEVMRNGAAGRATGLQMFTIGAVAEDPAKLAAMRRIYRAWSPGG
ncbi:MAG: hypothetical protein U5J83_00780 [Bryobacterales bacterium]|nr:hypothetical protein [Bryobacterales bacterium]